MVEPAAVLVATVSTIAGLRWSGLTAWWMTPAILLAAGMVPYLIRRQSPPAVLRVETLRQDVWTAACTGLAMLPLPCLAAWLIARAGVSLPWFAARPPNYPAWVAYQFLYVAVAEETFFRGYLLANLRGVSPEERKSEAGGQNQGLRCQQSALSIEHWAAIAASSGCFAAAHAVLQAQAAGLLTFLPGLVLGWLFVRTGTLLAPILFHGLANVVWQMTVGQ